MSGYHRYARTGIQTSDPRAVIVLLYEGALNFLKQASDALRAGDRAGMSDRILRVQRIIHHLSSALDFPHGEEIARRLASLYDYMRDTLNAANIACDAKKIDEVAALLQTLAEAWRQVAADPEAAAVVSARPSEADRGPAKGGDRSAVMSEADPGAPASRSLAPTEASRGKREPAQPPRVQTAGASTPTPAPMDSESGLVVLHPRRAQFGIPPLPPQSLEAGHAAYGLRPGA